MLDRFAKQWELPIYSISLGFILGCSAISLSGKDFKTFAGMLGSTAATISVGYVAYKKIDPTVKFKQSVAENEIEISRLETDRDNTIKDSLIHINQLRLLETACDELKKEISQLKADLRVSAQNQSVTSEASQSVVTDLNYRLGALQANLETTQKDSSQVIQKLEDELNEYDRTFDQRLNDEAEKRLKVFKRDQLEKIYSDFNGTAVSTVAIAKELEIVAHSYHDMAMGSEAKMNQIKAAYDDYIDRAVRTHQEALDDCSEASEAQKRLIERLKLTQQGLIFEPILKQITMSDSGRLSRAIAKSVFENFGLPLKMENWTELDDGFCKLGFTASSDENLEEVVYRLNGEAETIRKECFGFEKPKFKKSTLFDGIECSWQHKKKTRKADLSTILRSPQDLLKMLRDSRPFVRLIAAPQGGKTPMINLIVAEILRDGFASDTGSKVALTTVSYCDPLSGVSIKNTENLKFVDHHSSYDEAFKALAEERDFRTQKGNSDYTSETAYLWICDEFDEAISQDESRAKIIRSVSKNGTHMNIGVISASQTDQIGMLKMNTSDLKMWKTLLLDEESIRSFLENYSTKSIGDEKTKKLLTNLEEILIENKGLNETIADTARHFRFCLVIDGKYSAFYQLPYFDSAEFNVNSYIESRTRIATIRATNSHKSAVEPPQSRAETYTQQEPQKATFSLSPSTATKPHCPNCQSDNLKSNGANRYLCKDCGKSHAKSKSVMS